MRRKRKGVSDLIATMLLLAMTLVAGFALFGFVRAQANVSELSYAQSVGGTMSYLQERFVIPLVTYTTNTITVYVYTDGQIPTSLAQVEVFGPSRSAMDVVYDQSEVTVSNPPSCQGKTTATVSNESPMLGTGVSSLSVKVNYVASIVLTLPSCPGMSFQPGDVYFVSLLGVDGNTALYYQTM